MTGLPATPVTAAPQSPPGARRRARRVPAIGNAVTLLCRTLVEYPPTTVAAIATGTPGVPVHRLAASHHLDVARVSRLVRTCAAVQTITGFDFTDWPRACAGTAADPAALASLIVDQRPRRRPSKAHRRLGAYRYA
jgi:hypothetical protein